MKRLRQSLRDLRPRPIATAGALAACLFCALGLGACESAEKDRDWGSEARAVFGGGSGGETGEEGGGWCIVLATVQGEGALERAESIAAQLQTVEGLESAFAEERRSGAVVAMGSYSGPDDPDAKKDLARVRSLAVGERAMFPRSFIAPRADTAGAKGSMPELNLARAKELFPGAAYTLQVAVYESPDRSEAMRAAERAALALRSDGDLAFYYHGPSRSVVTVGAFAPRDFDAATGEQSPELLELRKKHPYNLYNGQAIKERFGSQSKSRLQSSALVEIP